MPWVVTIVPESGRTMHIDTHAKSVNATLQRCRVEDFSVASGTTATPRNVGARVSVAINILCRQITSPW